MTSEKISTSIHSVADDGIMSRREARGYAGGVSDATLWRMCRRGEFPQPVAISPGRVGWLRSEVKAWGAARAAARRNLTEDKAAA